MRRSIDDDELSGSDDALDRSEDPLRSKARDTMRGAVGTSEGIGDAVQNDTALLGAASSKGRYMTSCRQPAGAGEGIRFCLRTDERASRPSDGRQAVQARTEHAQWRIPGLAGRDLLTLCRHSLLYGAHSQNGTKSVILEI